ncbi:timeless-domain-containing protein [Sodiomyces alkalinus F11]|uniref:Topoisomerase 1-associated factor 1 n=1 Tax=Sodiomyces alkalinus (strain CBS 110278 / VKM F-3762 / F11) TaxID=1314773 RepID=A0A3N2PXJ4_SODAK|nr:timeless-domain-containing protein [Sodiomyces alkalinus F11]ROT39253.1 timeless-domain-containing protein [Sodiomyces alkalinus F11]
MMETTDGTNDIVHPEVRAHINSLVSALGGFSADDDGRYKLGDDALDVLRDLKKWIRFYDEKTNRMDVARCIAEANLVEGDLLHILAMWPENATENKFRARMALACLEIMVPLTWPLDRDPEKMTVNHHRHIPMLELAQVAYKRAIINFDGARILHTAVRAALPAMAVPIGDRSQRDQGIIKLMLFFLRNVVMLEPPANIKYDGDESQISRSATIDAFSYQDIFMVLLTLASNMGEDFRTEDVIAMEIIYHLVKRVDMEQMFMSEQQLNKSKAKELSSMMGKEAAMLKAYNRKGPTRHNRFGTMVWMQREGGKMSSISGQDALVDLATRQQKIDDSKTFRPPRRPRKKDEMEPKDLGREPKLNHRANTQLRSFVEDFLDAGFNPLFEHVRKSIDREASHVLSHHKRQFMYLVAWFLEAERVRRSAKQAAKPRNSSDDVSSFNLVAGVLNQSMFITLNRTMTQAWEHKDWPELTASMRCFTQILLTVQEMSESPNEEDQEIAENMLSRLFYEDATHDLVANVVRQYKGQGFDYLDAATELTHHFVRILEGYSKQNVDLQVRSRRRTRRKKKVAKATAPDAGDGGNDALDGEDDDESANDESRAEQTSKERKFDFQRFSMRFTPQGVVDAFVAFTKYYKDLNDGQLKRAHRYFYRLAFKQEMSVMLFRVDIIHLFHGMIKGPEPLDKGSKMYKEWEELAKQMIRKCIRKIQERPALLIEMLFSKTNGTAFYLEYGHEKQTVSATKPRPATELEFKYTEDREQQIAIAVGVLLDKNQSDHIAWVKKTLADAEQDRRASAIADQVLPSVEMEVAADGTGPSAEETASTSNAAGLLPFTVRPDNDARRTAMFKNPHLRLLMRLVGMQRLTPNVEETPETLWVLPPDVTADDMKETLGLIGKAEFSPPVFEEGVLAEHQLRRKTAPRRKAEYDDDDDDDDDADDEDDDIGNEFLFPAGGPTERKVADADKGKKKPKLRRRRRRGEDNGDDNNNNDDAHDSELEEKARKRREREREKARKIKSQLYVTASDDETDEERDREFFAREEELRRRMAKNASSDAASGVVVSSQAPPSRKRKRPQLMAIGEDDDDLVVDAHATGSSRASLGADGAGDSDQNVASDGTADTALSSSSGRSARKRRRVSPGPETEGVEELGKEVGGVVPMQIDGEDVEDEGDEGDEEDEEEVVRAPASRARPRKLGGFLIDSSDEE